MCSSKINLEYASLPMGMDIAGLMPDHGRHLHDNGILTLKICDFSIAEQNCNFMTPMFISMLMHSERLSRWELMPLAGEPAVRWL